MTVKQISVFVENKAGKLAELTEYLHEQEIDMRALSIAETQDFGIVRIIVDDAYKTSCILKGQDMWPPLPRCWRWKCRMNREACLKF